MNLIQFAHNKYTINLKGFDITTSKGILRDPMIVFRLLNYDELKRIETCFNNVDRLSSIVLDQEIFSSCVIGVVGFFENPFDEFTVNNMESGFIGTIADIIHSLSLSFIKEHEERLGEMHNEVEFMEQMKSVLCRYLNTSYSEVSEWPIDDIFRRYATLQYTFPHELMPQENHEQ